MLDLSRVAGQVAGMVAEMRRGAGERQQHLTQALGLLQDKSLDLEKLKQKITRAKTTWLVAQPVGPLGSQAPAPTIPAEYTALATDGSHIDVDRHQAARCFLLNIGRVRLDYGAQPDARLESLPQLGVGAGDLVLSDGLREQAVEGNLLSIKRAVEELRHLAEMAKEVAPSHPTLALVDGSLILWGLTGEKYPAFVLEALLKQGYLKHLSALRELGRRHNLALASYVSFPRSTDVVNTLRVALCPHEVPDCDKYCQEVANGQRPCAGVAGVQDRDLFGEVLQDGARSGLFITQSKVVQEHYPAPIYFYYLRAGEEMARVEVPEWVAADAGKLDLTHALLLDQARRGQGYPVALSEAHEQAVVTGADRAGFQQLLEMWLTAEHLSTATSLKSQSKRTRWV